MPKMVVILVGLPGTGKSESGKFFNQKEIPVIRMGNLTRKFLKKNKLTQTEKNESLIRQDLRKKFGKDVYAREVLREVKKSQKTSDLVIIDGMRSPEEWEYLSKYLDNPQIIYLEAKKKKRIDRLTNRSSRPLSLSEIKLREDYEIKKLNIKKLKKYAGFVIQNDLNKENIYKKLEKAILKFNNL